MIILKSNVKLTEEKRIEKQRELKEEFKQEVIIIPSEFEIVHLDLY